MKCVGAEDGQKQCQRCKRANVECIFEKHRRGRKPGSKLSEASKMLRRLEKGLIQQKRKSNSSEAHAAGYGDSTHTGASDSFNNGARGDPYSSSPNTHFPSNELPPLNLPHQYSAGNDYPNSASSSRTMDMDEDDDDETEQNNDGLFPAKMIRKENQRNSFFRTILNPEDETVKGQQPRGTSYSPPHSRTPTAPPGPSDPIESGLMNEEEAKVLFDAIFIRLNPFINLFDPALHTVNYVRSKCRFLFTTLIMAGCRFFRPELFKQCQKLAHDFAVQAFAQAWKRVEVVQAFACLTYWRDPDDNRTWTYIGYALGCTLIVVQACRMAVELGLNRFVPVPPPHETEFQLLERRNRERTYLVLFVHDRSLSTQTGRSWMLPEDALVRHSGQWHEWGGSTIRPEDVIVAAFVQLRHIAAETTEIFHDSKHSSGHADIKYDVVLRNCNGKLTQWMDTWTREMHKAGGEAFHFSFLSLFRLYVRLFLNSFGIQDSVSSGGQSSPSVQAMSACYSSAIDHLRILSQDFADMSMLRYGQDTITIMSAYSAVFLLKLLRSSHALPQLHEGAAREIHTAITKTADAYHAASNLSPASTQAAYHARFLRSLLTNDLFGSRRREKARYDTSSIDPRLQAGPESQPVIQSPSQMYAGQSELSHEQTFHFPASPHMPAHPITQQPQYQTNDLPMRQTPQVPVNTMYPGGGYSPPTTQHASELDAQYWKNMFLDLGFGGNDNPMAASMPQNNGNDVRSTYAHQGTTYHLAPSHPGYGH
ncbi:hypothetical protein CPB85DRAFT_1489996 [Mucidula mucida]|nr:hypothetical protein CPB85DRAFT_1489996 [Mucidula mucida]